MDVHNARIAVLGPIAWRTPPEHYGAWETVAGNITEGLVQRGYDVTLFATADSRTNAKLQAVCPRPYEEDRSLDPKVWECMHIAECMEHAAQFDLIHNNYDFLPLTYSRLIRTPMLTTIHGFSSDQVRLVYRRYRDNNYVSISDADRDPELPYLATVYNGIQLNDFPFNAVGGDDLIFLGRFHPEKGPHLAIALAKRTKRRLIMAGILQDQAFWETEIAPQIDGEQIVYVGPVGGQDRSDLLGSGAALLHLVTQPERFGLVMAEALACGTPVIGIDLGSVREVVRDGVTGFVVPDVDQAVAAVDQLSAIDRHACRRDVDQRFSMDRMIDGYLKVYEQLLK
jgi:glycosyltransferase involved in cell wall biosynthesis